MIGICQTHDLPRTGEREIEGAIRAEGHEARAAADVLGEDANGKALRHAQTGRGCVGRREGQAGRRYGSGRIGGLGRDLGWGIGRGFCSSRLYVEGGWKRWQGSVRGHGRARVAGRQKE